MERCKQKSCPYFLREIFDWIEGAKLEFQLPLELGSLRNFCVRVISVSGCAVNSNENNEKFGETWLMLYKVFCIGFTVLSAL